MPLDIQAGGKPPSSYPLQFVNIEITPLIDGQYAVVMQATLLDEDELASRPQDTPCLFQCFRRVRHAAQRRQATGRILSTGTLALN